VPARGGMFGALVAFLAFVRALGFGFVYDDSWTLTQNTALDGPLRPLLAAMANGTAPGLGIPDATRPAMVVSMWVDHQLFGNGPFGYHLHSLVLYAVVTAVAFFAARSLIGGGVASIVAACFFALSPIHAEVACAINYREDLIAALGILVPLAWLFRRDDAEDTLPAGLLVAAIFAWGLLGKENTASLVVIVLAIAPLARVGRAWWMARERTIFLLASVFVLWIEWRWALVLGGDGIPRAARAPIVVRVFDTARFELRAVWAALVPFATSPEYAAEPHASPLLLGLLLLPVLAVVVLRRTDELRPIAIGLTLALTAALPASPLAGPINARADRYLFVGALGGGLVWGTVIRLIQARLPSRAWASLGGATVLLGTVLCFRAAGTWRDERSLWSYAVERAPGSPRAWAALSRVERRAGNLNEADRLIERALALDPRHLPSHVTRAYNLLARGEVAAARAEIAAIEAIDNARGSPPRGLALARSCAAETPENAKQCVAGTGAGARARARNGDP
jgi:Dolichyl-phosphate-mannose-protein mannosyltransferase